MAKRNIEPRKGLWNLPCGFLENDESVMDGAIRETFEECKAKVEVDHLHCIFDLVGFHQVYLVFKAHMLEDGISTTPESSEVRFMSPEEIPWDEIAFESSRFALRKWIDNNNLNDKGLHFGKFSKFANHNKSV